MQKNKLARPGARFDWELSVEDRHVAQVLWEYRECFAAMLKANREPDQSDDAGYYEWKCEGLVVYLADVVSSSTFDQIEAEERAKLQ